MTNELRQHINRCGITAAAAFVAGVVVSAQGATPGGPLVPTPESYYGARERVEISQPVSGDAVVAGRDVTIWQPVSGDILAAGANVTIAAPASDDVRVAGRTVRLNAPIAGDLTAAGGTLIVGPRSHVTGKAWLAGGEVRADGVFERAVSIAGGHVQIAGELRQPVHVVAQELEVLSTARILAPLTYEGPAPAQVATGAVLSHPIAYRNLPTQATESTGRVASSVVFAIHLFVGGLLLFLLLPRFAVDPVQVLRREPGLSLLTGFSLFVLVPVAALLFLISLIGIPVGLALGALYVIALFLGLVTTAFCVGRLEATFLGGPITTRGAQARYLLAGVGTLGLIRIIPVIGPLVVFLSILYGLGALGVWVYRARWHGAATSVAG